jgi:hypothetical protein
VWAQFQRADGTWLSNGSPNDPLFGNSSLGELSTGNGTDSTVDIVDASIGLDTSYVFRIVFTKVSYSGYSIGGSTTALGTTARSVLVETYLNFSIYSRTPHYW